MSLKTLAEDGSVEKSQEMVRITLKLQNLRGIWVSYLVWSIEMSLTEIQLGPYFLREFRPFIFLSSKLRWRLRYISCR
jgi:hypothetical protein